MGSTEAPSAGDGMDVADELCLVDGPTPSNELSGPGGPGAVGAVGAPVVDRPDDAPPGATRPHPDSSHRRAPDEALTSQERERRREAVIHHLQQARRRRRPHQTPFS